VRFRKGQSSGAITDSSIEDSLNDKVKSIRAILNEKADIISGFDTAKEVKDYIIKMLEAGNEIDFLKFANEYKDSIKNESTKAYNVTRINALTEYVLDKTGKLELPISKINYKLLKDYENWLRVTNRKSKKANEEKAGLSENSINSYMGAISIIFNAAKKKYNDYDTGDILIKNDPFKSYTPPRLESTKKRAVEKEIIQKIYDYHSDKEVPQMTRDLFLMSFFLCGMNLVDIYECDPFTERVNYARIKTRDHKKEKPYLSLVIHPIAKELIDKYRDIEEIRGFCFYKKYSNMPAFHQAIRRGISVLRRELGIPDLTYYVARHSFATIARNKCGVSKDDVSLCLTHESGNSMTDTYIDIDFSIIDNVINRVVDYVFGDK
ncbi:tyrosine-type recombinase/integrase, partial [Parabacteroides leei]